MLSPPVLVEPLNAAINETEACGPTEN